jgi:hypothetical protein
MVHHKINFQPLFKIQNLPAQVGRLLRAGKFWNENTV